MYTPRRLRPHPAEESAEPYPVNPEALPTTDVDLRRKTTTTPTNTKGGRSGSSGNDHLKFADWVPNELRAAAIEKVARLDATAAQIVIDEWAGALATDRIDSSPLGYH